MNRLFKISSEEIKAAIVSDAQTRTQLPSFNEENLLAIVKALAEKVQKIDGDRGNIMNAAVTLKDLFDLGVIAVNLGGQVISTFTSNPNFIGDKAFIPIAKIDQADPCSSVFTPPPAPTGFEVTAGVVSVVLKWDRPTFPCYGFTEVFRSQEDNIGEAQKVGQSDTEFFVDAPNQGVHFYWIRHVSRSDVSGTFNALNGTRIEILPAIEMILGIVDAEIRNGDLFKDLTDRIDLIDGDELLENSVNSRLAREKTLREQADIAIDLRLLDFKSDVSDSVVKLQESILVTQTMSQTIATTLDNLIVREDDEAEASIAAVMLEKTARVAQDEALAMSISNVSASVQNVTAALSQEQTARVEADTAITKSVTTQFSSVNNSLASIRSALTTLSGSDGSIASSLQTLSAKVDTKNTISRQSTAPVNAKMGDIWYHTGDGDKPYIFNGTSFVLLTDGRLTDLSSSISTESRVRASQTEGLFAQYAVKIDTGGFVSGFGLASTAPIGGTATSDFIVRADRFSIAAPANSGSTLAPKIPFVVTTTAQKINGVDVPAGVYISDGFIQNGTITNAKIGNAAIDNAKIANLDAAKITAGTLDSNRIAANSIDATKIDSRGLTIKDANGNVIFSSGNGLNFKFLSSIPAGIYNSNIQITSDGKLTGAGDGQVTFSGLGGKALGTIDKITKTNVSTYIEAASIGTALIKDAAITSALIEDATIGSAEIANTLQSTNYVAGQAGWRIDKSGFMEIGSGLFRGELAAATGTFNGVFSGRISAGAIDVTGLDGLAPFIFERATGETLVHTTGFDSSTIRFSLAGGGGGGSATQQSRSGGGGGAASSVRDIVVTNIPKGTQIFVTIGAGGAGGVNGGNGSNGQQSTLRIGGVVYTSSGGIGAASFSDGSRPDRVSGMVYRTNDPGDAAFPASGQDGVSANVVGSVGGQGGGRSRTDLSHMSGTRFELTGKDGVRGGGGGGGACPSSFVGSRGFFIAPISGEFGNDGSFSGGNGGSGFAVIEVSNPNSVVKNSEFKALVGAMSTFFKSAKEIKTFKQIGTQQTFNSSTFTLESRPVFSTTEFTLTYSWELDEATYKSITNSVKSLNGEVI